MIIRPYLDIMINIIRKYLRVSKPDIAQCFFVIFIIKPEFENLNFYEAKWYRILNAKININKMILPRI